MSNDRSYEGDDLHNLDLSLPPLPRTLPQVLKLLHSQGFVDVGDMVEVAQRDPAVAAGLLEHINSAQFGLSRSITSVERAIQMMGSTSAAGTILGLSMVRMEELLEGPAGSCFTRIVRHSEGVALLTRYLLERMPRDDRGHTNGTAGNEDEDELESDGFMEGLLHDLGKLVLIYNYPEKAVSLYEDKVFEGYLADTDERDLEQLVFGYDHTEAGAYAATEMNFPRSLVEINRHHHDAEEASLQGEAARKFRAVCAANLATKAMGPAFNGVSAFEETIDWEECASHPIWSHWRTEPELGEQAPEEFVEDLRTKKRDTILFTDFFLDGPDFLEGPDAWMKAASVA